MNDWVRDETLASRGHLSSSPEMRTYPSIEHNVGKSTIKPDESQWRPHFLKSVVKQPVFAGFASFSPPGPLYSQVRGSVPIGARSSFQRCGKRSVYHRSPVRLVDKSKSRLRGVPH